MEMVRAARQTIALQRSILDTYFNMALAMLDQTAGAVDLMVAGATLVHENRRAIAESLRIYRKGCEDMKRFVDEGFNGLQGLVAQVEKSPLSQMKL